MFIMAIWSVVMAVDKLGETDSGPSWWVVLAPLWFPPLLAFVWWILTALFFMSRSGLAG